MFGNEYVALSWFAVPKQFGAVSKDDLSFFELSNGAGCDPPARE